MRDGERDGVEDEGLVLGLLLVELGEQVADVGDLLDDGDVALEQQALGGRGGGGAVEGAPVDGDERHRLLEQHVGGGLGEEGRRQGGADEADVQDEGLAGEGELLGEGVVVDGVGEGVVGLVGEVVGEVDDHACGDEGGERQGEAGGGGGRGQEGARGEGKEGESG